MDHRVTSAWRGGRGDKCKKERKTKERGRKKIREKNLRKQGRKKQCSKTQANPAPQWWSSKQHDDGPENYPLTSCPAANSNEYEMTL